jgi:hypothetical protein
MSLKKQELLTLPDHLEFFPVFKAVNIVQSLIFCVVFVDHCLCFISVGRYIVLSAEIESGYMLEASDFTQEFSTIYYVIYRGNLFLPIASML